jgi:hypothetical protein
MPMGLDGLKNGVSYGRSIPIKRGINGAIKGIFGRSKETGNQQASGMATE